METAVVLRRDIRIFQLLYYQKCTALPILVGSNSKDYLMSRLAEFRALEQQLAAQLAELENMKNDEGLKREVEFEEKLRDLLGEYGFSLKHIVEILDPQGSSRRTRAPAPEPEKATRRARQVKRYKHPESGEVVETKGGNHKVLKEWKAQYGAETVESWLQ